MTTDDKRQLDREMTAILAYLPGWQLDPRYNDHCWCAVLIDGTGRGVHVNIQQSQGPPVYQRRLAYRQRPPPIHTKQMPAYHYRP